MFSGKKAGDPEKGGIARSYCNPMKKWLF